MPALTQPPRTPWWQREGAISRVLSAVGAGVLLIGVTFLLVLAIQHGYFGPVPRVVVSAVVAGLLILIGLVVHRRQPGNAGAVALLATGVAGGYLDVVAVTTIYAWVPLWAGLLMAGALASLGLVLARRWNSQLVAVLVVAGVVVLAPVIGGDELWMSSAFLVLVSVGAGLVHLDRSWPVLHAVRIAPTALVLAVSALSYWGQSDRLELLVCAGLSTGFALASMAGEAQLIRRGHGGAMSAVMIGLAGLPALVAVPWGTTTVATTIWLVTLAGVWAVGSLAIRQSAAQAVLLSLSALALLVTLHDVDVFDQAVVAGQLVVAVTFVAVALVTGQRIVGWVGLGTGGVALSFYLPILEPLLDGADGRLGFWDLLASLLGLSLAILAYAFVRPTARRQPLVWWTVSCWALALLSVTGVSVSVGMMVGRSIANPGSGFIGGHAGATLVWMGGAAWLLMRSLGQPSRRHLSAGMTIAGLAVAKLLLFDLATLDGLIRVVAFVVAGAVLLTLGTLYARSMTVGPPAEVSGVPRA